jgi:tRNA modification GTPase
LLSSIKALRKCGGSDGGGESHSDDRRAPLARLQHLLALAPLGRHLTRPWRVFIAGAPNVGKSSLMNALVGYQRSIVFDQPGTTRDLLTAVTALDGWPVELVDSAGLRESEDALEAAGVARATAGMAGADLVLWVEDATERAEVAHPRLCVGVLVVKNKADLLPAGAIPSDSDALAVSALTGQGLDKLCQRIVEQMLPIPLAPGEGVIFTQRQEQRWVNGRSPGRQIRGGGDVVAELTSRA